MVKSTRRQFFAYPSTLGLFLLAKQLSRRKSSIPIQQNLELSGSPGSKAGETTVERKDEEKRERRETRSVR